MCIRDSLSDAAEGSSFREVGGDYYDPTAGANEANLAKACLLYTSRCV